jgi:hypothetical protein
VDISFRRNEPLEVFLWAECWILDSLVIKVIPMSRQNSSNPPDLLHVTERSQWYPDILDSVRGRVITHQDVWLHIAVGNQDAFWPLCLKGVRTRQGQYHRRVARGLHPDAYPWPPESNDSTQRSAHMTCLNASRFELCMTLCDHHADDVPFPTHDAFRSTVLLSKRTAAHSIAFHVRGQPRRCPEREWLCRGSQAARPPA